jgi:DNA-binding NtrC family response regulator
MSSSESKKLHILVVDDEHTITMLLARGLRDEGFEVIVANSVFEARERIKSILQNGGLDVVLTDWDMKPDGLAAGAKVLEASRLSGINKLIAMSGRLILDGRVGDAEDEVKREMRLAGATGFIEKPFSVQQAVQAITSVMETDQSEAENK